jgi:hypothetical protein
MNTLFSKGNTKKENDSQEISLNTFSKLKQVMMIKTMKLSSKTSENYKLICIHHCNEITFFF